MLKIVCAVFDVKSERFNDPFFVPAIGTAIRGFADHVNDKDQKGDIQRHPEDFSLFEMGTYDDNCGLLVSVQPPRLLVRGSDSAIKEGV